MSTNDLRMLYNTLCMIETKGENTKMMAECLAFIQQKIKENDTKTTENNTNNVDNP